MKPIVYLAAFRKGKFNLGSAVPDECNSVPNGAGQNAKRISNYDGEFKGMIPPSVWRWRNPETQLQSGSPGRSA
jgi:membrane carboxypeptidase/penicillin-binding protein